MFTQQWIAIAISAALIGRALAVYTCGLIIHLLHNSISFGWQYILVWGGLRGAIAIVLSLSLPLSLSYGWTMPSMVFGAVLFLLLVQSTTTASLIRKYGSGHFRFAGLELR